MKTLLSRLALIGTASAALFACGDDTGDNTSPFSSSGLPTGGIPTDVVPIPSGIPGLCDFQCKTIAEAGAGISGIREVDAFFGAVGNFQAQAGSLEADVRLELLSMAAALGIDGSAMATGELAAAISGGVAGGFGGMIDGNLSIGFAPPKCEVSATASVQAAAKCDATVDPGSVSVECEGSCEASGSAMASCSGGATLTCKGTAPGFKCEGTCSGTCEVAADAKCEGECNGTCEVHGDVACNGTCEMNGTAACDGECMGSTDAGGNCTGECKLSETAMCNGTCKLNAGATCEGSCKGSCELKAGGTCNGECKGECEYTPPSGMCEATATAKCEASAEAKVECNGKCSGEAKPPMVKAECEATAKAEASFNAECTPPSLDIKYNLTTQAQADFAADVNVKAAFEGKIQAFGKAFANLTAKGAKIEAIIKAGGDLGSSGAAAVDGALQAAGSGTLSTGASLDLACGIAAFATVPAMLTEASGSLAVSAKAVADITLAVKG